MVVDAKKKTNEQRIYKHDFGEESRFRMEWTCHAIHRGKAGEVRTLKPTSKRSVWHEIKSLPLKSKMGILALILEGAGRKQSLFTPKNALAVHCGQKMKCWPTRAELAHMHVLNTDIIYII